MGGEEEVNGVESAMEGNSDVELEIISSWIDCNRGNSSTKEVYLREPPSNICPSLRCCRPLEGM